MFELLQNYVKKLRAAEKFGNGNFKTCRFSKKMFFQKKLFLDPSMLFEVGGLFYSIVHIWCFLGLEIASNCMKNHEKRAFTLIFAHKYVSGSYLYLGPTEKFFSIFLRFSEAKSTVVNLSKKRVILARAECKYRPYRQW